MTAGAVQTVQTVQAVQIVSEAGQRLLPVIPAHTGIQVFGLSLDVRLRGHDD
ncbi:MAG: hypothetical protein ACREQ2_28425 [Candidatus Binatia bacterium]